MLRSSRHPYQSTILPQPHLHVRNPWQEKPESSTNSSCGSRSGRTVRNTISPPTSEWLLPRNQTLSHHGPLLNQQVHPVVMPSQGPNSALSTLQGSSVAVSATGGIGSCGGQCIACETFCYYCLQVMFIAGILTGIALTIAGSVLSGSHKEGDLVVLVYIGVLLVLVCILLLSVHCCVRKNVKERKRALRLTLMDGVRRGMNTHGDFTSVPVQDFSTNQPYRNSFTDTNVHEFDGTENLRSLVNSTQYRTVPTTRAETTRIHGFDRHVYGPGPHLADHQRCDWGKNRHLDHHRSFR